MAPGGFPSQPGFCGLCKNQVPSIRVLRWRFMQRWIKLSSQVFIPFAFNLFDLSLPLLEPDANEAAFFVSNKF